jgi:predicted RNA-binding protein YlxR (DUF448 family)
VVERLVGQLVKRRPQGSRLAVVERVVPMRTCVGCKQRAAKSDLLRLAVVTVDEHLCVVPDPRGQRPGRGASLHPVPHCLDLAERRRAFPRAFRLPGPLDSAAVREHVEGRATQQ